MQSVLRQALQLHFRRARFCIFLPSRHVDVRDQAKHPDDIRAGDHEAFFVTVEKVTRDRVFDSRRGMSILAYGIHEELIANKSLRTVTGRAWFLRRDES